LHEHGLAQKSSKAFLFVHFFNSPIVAIEAGYQAFLPAARELRRER